MLKLVYGCLAISLVALAALMMISSGGSKHYHGVTSSMIDAVTEGALVLDADAHGAVTQTGNGRLSGWTRDGRRIWSMRFTRFPAEAQRSFASPAKDAVADCAGDCPAAIVRLGDDSRAFGGAGIGLAETFSALSPRSSDVLTVPTHDRAWLRTGDGDRTRPGLLSIVARQTQVLPLTSPQVVLEAVSGRRALVATASGRVGTIHRLVRRGEKWQRAGATISERGMQNVCFSSDGRYFATISDKIEIRRWDGRVLGRSAKPVNGGVCTIGPGGVSAVSNPQAEPGTLRLSRWTLRGEPRWSHSLGARRLLSRGGSRFAVTHAPGDVLKIWDMFSGAVVTERRVPQPPLVGADGSTVVATRDGTPIWLAAPPIG